MASSELGVSREARRGAVAGLASMAMHGGVVLIAFWLIDREVDAPVQPQPQSQLTEIEVVDPPASTLPPERATVPPTAQPSAQLGAASASAGERGHRGPTTPRRVPSGESVPSESLVDFTVSYDDPDSFAPRTGESSEGLGLGNAELGLGLGGGLVDNGIGLGVPAPPSPSLARAARPKHDYSYARFRDVLRFAGRTILVELTIDPRGAVRDVKLLRGVVSWLDRDALALTHTYEFEPALDDAGDPTWSRLRWKLALYDNRPRGAGRLPELGHL